MIRARIDASQRLLRGALEEIEADFRQKPNIEEIARRLSDSQKVQTPAHIRLMESFRKVVADTPLPEDIERVKDALALLRPVNR